MAGPDKCQICLCRRAVWIWRASPECRLRLCQWTADRFLAKGIAALSELRPIETK